LKSNSKLGVNFSLISNPFEGPSLKRGANYIDLNSPVNYFFDLSDFIFELVFNTYISSKNISKITRNKDQK